MDNLKIVGAPLPDMPWEDRPEGSKEVLWRYSKNPVLARSLSTTAAGADCTKRSFESLRSTLCRKPS